MLQLSSSGASCLKIIKSTHIHIHAHSHVHVHATHIRHAHIRHLFGDRAIIDTDGYVSISGRTKDIVIRGGENIPVKEVEDVLLRHPNVANVAVVAQLHERLGEVGCAVILADGDPPTLADLITFLDEQNVTKQFWPEDLRVVDQFPMTPSGKVQKYHLRDIVNSPA